MPILQTVWIPPPTPPPPLTAYRALMECRIIALDKCPGVRAVGIGETLRQAISKVVIRASGDQLNTACRSLQLCAGIEVGLEGMTHPVVQRQRERNLPVPEGRAEEESEDGSSTAADDADRDGGEATTVGVGEVCQCHQGERTQQRRERVG